MSVLPGDFGYVRLTVTRWPFLRNWTWTAQVAFTLHMFVLLMKMHSYAFYNGHLSETKRVLDELDIPGTPITEKKVFKYPTPTSRLHEVQQAPEEPQEDQEDGHPEKGLRQMRDDLAVELTSPLGRVTYPQNLSLKDFITFLASPTLCYELEYPRTEHIRLFEVFIKTLAVFGCVFLLIVISEEFVMPVLDESTDRLQQRQSLAEISLIFAETISRLLFPFMMIFLLVFLVIFEYLLGVLAELTRFADRRFYDDFWNSCDWLQFSRSWNIPVHRFLMRHCYAALSRDIGLPVAPSSSNLKKGAGANGKAKTPTRRSALVSRPVATFVTFLISALAHEVLMGVITKKLRGYGFVAMMLQMPIVLVQRSRWVRGRTLLNVSLEICF